MDSPFALSILLIIFFILSAFFSGTEAAFIALNKIRLRHLQEKGAAGAGRVWHLVSRLDELISTVLFCNNLVNTAIAAIATFILVQVLGPEWGVVTSTIGVTFFLLIFGEITPKIFATNHPEFVAFGFRHVVSFLILFLRPVVQVLTRISNFVLKVVGGRPRFRKPLVTEEEIKMLITVGKEEGYYGDSERHMLDRIFHFDEIEVMEVMSPFDKIVSVDLNVPEDELADILMEKGHNRIPVYDKDPQNILGILYVHDLLYLMKNSQLIRLQDLISAPYYVLPAMKVSVLLKEFQNKKMQIALVRATNNRILGLVTLEDLLEEIVGEIEEFTPIEKEL